MEFKYDTQLLIEGHGLNEDEINDYFRNNFKELTGITPSEYRRKSKRNN